MPTLLLVNLGTPTAPTAAAVSAYLDEFLSDPRVVQLPRWLWLPLLRKVILPRRSPVVAKKYAEVWLPGGSPLAVHTAALADAVRTKLPGWRVEHAMRYGTPSLADILQRLREEGVRDVRVLPLYPQYSTTTTETVADVIAARRGEMRVSMLRDYHRDAGWAAAVADSIRAHWARHGRGERLLLSFHGLPQRVVDAGDPYALQCEASAQAIAQALGIARDDILLTYQSRFGKGKWLQPDVVATLQGLARDGVRMVDVACPGFAVDCLETLEEIAMQDAVLFREAGGDALRYIPCLNAGDAHAEALAALAQRDEGWH
ncbi:ferrochelatase [Thermomonas sp. HDW16]|uniref:ferrochelatase n=1 Tax=Thermomonas sp. HDW16 TaxID=2714945 RepID=UPI001980A554|nr:ferrochelatase [Thermomonas sp. HDW16]